jgi:hypothetical protein
MEVMRWGTKNDYLEKYLVENEKNDFIIKIEDSYLISDIVLNAKQGQTSEYIDYRYQQEQLAKQNVGARNPENTKPTSNTSPEQTKSAVQYQSSLEAMLRAIQVYSLQKALKETNKIDLDRKVKEVDLTEEKFCNDLFSIGIFKDYINKIINKTLDERDPIQKDIKYGFNAAILSNKITGDIPKEIEVEVVMSEIVTDDFVGMQGIPKLDNNGCLILKKI